MAFSYASTDPSDLEDGEVARMIVDVSSAVCEWVLKNGMPPGVDVISVNFPREPARSVCVVPLARRRFSKEHILS